MIGYARGDAIDMEETLARFPQRLKSVPDFVDAGVSR